MNRRLRLFCLLVLLTGVACVPSGADAQEPSRRPIVNVGPIDIDFGDINVGELKSVPVTVRNLTTGNVAVAGGSITGNGFSALGGTCTATIAAGVSCTFNYRFRPLQSSGAMVSATTTLQFTQGGNLQAAPITLRGRGVGTLVEMSPTTFDYGNTFLGQVSSVAVVVRNPRDTQVLFSGGGFNDPGSFTGGGGTCSNSLAPGATCQIVYNFVPNQLGDAEAGTSISMTLQAPEGGSVTESYPIELLGTGVNTTSIAHVRPTFIGFGRAKIGRTLSALLRFTNTSPGQISFGGGGINPEWSDGGAFINTGVTAQPGCSSSTATSGATCHVGYGLRPYALREFNGQSGMGYTYMGNTQSETFLLQGTGVGTLAQVSPLSVDFGAVDIGTTISVPVTVYNDSDQTLTAFQGGSVLNPFSGNTTCTGTLAAGASCVYTYSFTAHSGSIGPQMTQTAITFANPQGNQPVHTITLRATGTSIVFRNGFE